MIDPIKVLKEVAQGFRARVSSLNLLDSNAPRSTVDFPDSGVPHERPATHFTRQASFVYNGYRIRVMASSGVVAVELRGEFDLSTVLSLNRPDLIMCCTHQVRIGSPLVGNRVFLRRGESVQAHQTLIEMVIDGASSLHLTANESLHVYQNGLIVYLAGATLPRVHACIEALSSLANRLPAALAEPEPDVPEQFRSLKPLIRRWGTTDDYERSNRMSRATTSTLERLVTLVAPHLPEINQWLDSLEDKPMSEGAVAIGAVAEAAVEASILLERRRRSGKRSA